MLFRNPALKKEILEFQKGLAEGRSSNKIKDVHDSELYKQINGNGDKYLTYNLSTDGAPLTKTGKRGFWPLQILPNFLPPAIRFKFVLLAGILTTTKEPNSHLTSLFFSIFIEEALRLYRHGIQIMDLDNKNIVRNFASLCLPVDTICRPILQNRLQFNVYCGCSWCYHMGEYIRAVSGIRYPMKAVDELRSHESHKKD